MLNLAYLKAKFLTLLKDYGRKGCWKNLIIDEYKVNDLGDQICIFSHYNKSQSITVGTTLYLEAIKKSGFSIVFVSTSFFSNQADIEFLKKYCDLILIRGNIGYDFGSWATGLEFLDVERCTRLLLVNDSVIGPLNGSLNDLFDKAISKDLDFWGVTDSNEISYHIQSYFICLESKAIKSGALDFLKKVKSYKKKQSVIVMNEIGFSIYAIRKGLKVSAIIPISELIQTINHELYSILNTPLIKINPILRCSVNLVKNQNIPFIKRELIEKNPYKIRLDFCIDLFKKSKHLSECERNILINQAQISNVHYQ